MVQSTGPVSLCCALFSRFPSVCISFEDPSARRIINSSFIWHIYIRRSRDHRPWPARLRDAVSGCCRQIFSFGVRWHGSKLRASLLVVDLHLQRNIKAEVTARSLRSIELYCVPIEQFALSRETRRVGALQSARGEYRLTLKSLGDSS